MPKEAIADCAVCARRDATPAAPAGAVTNELRPTAICEARAWPYCTRGPLYERAERGVRDSRMQFAGG